MKAIKTTLSKKIRNLRESKNLTQEQLAENAGLSGKFIGEIERGTSNPTIKTIEKIAKALKTSPAQLLAEEGEIIPALTKKDLQTIN